MINVRLVLAAPIFLLVSMPAPAQMPSQGPVSAAPVPTGIAHACGTEWYPAAALAAGEQGRTTLSFRIGADGIPKNISVASTSGFPDLDEAATKCVKTWKYQPATVAGIAVEADWKTSVEWSMPTDKPVNVVITRGGHPGIVPPDQQPIGSQICPNSMRPPAPLGKITKVMFRVLRDGSVTNVILFESSGDERLDEMALSCVKQRRYMPRTNGSNREFLVQVIPVPW